MATAASQSLNVCVFFSLDCSGGTLCFQDSSRLEDSFCASELKQNVTPGNTYIFPRETLKGRTFTLTYKPDNLENTYFLALLPPDEYPADPNCLRSIDVFFTEQLGLLSEGKICTAKVTQKDTVEVGHAIPGHNLSIQNSDNPIAEPCRHIAESNSHSQTVHLGDFRAANRPLTTGLEPFLAPISS